MFKNAAALGRVYPALLDHAIKRLSSKDVLRFLGRRVNRPFAGEASASYLDRRVEISRAANERYLEALAVVEVPSPAGTLLDAVSRRTMTAALKLRDMDVAKLVA